VRLWTGLRWIPSGAIKVPASLVSFVV
jgi:hypothetical protein